MESFVEEFNLRNLAEARMLRLVLDYHLDPIDFAIDYDEGSSKWTLTYDP